MLSSMRKLKEVSAGGCPKLDEIHIAGVLESLEFLGIDGCDAFGSLLLAHGVLLLFVRVSSSFFSIESSSHNYLMRPTMNVKSSSSEPDGMNEGVKMPLLLYFAFVPMEIWRKEGAVAFTDPLMVWHAEGSAQERMHIPGRMEELLASSKGQHVVIRCPSSGEAAEMVIYNATGFVNISGFCRRKGVCGCIHRQLMVWHAEGSAQEQMHIPGKMVELLALFKTSPGLEEDHEAGEQAAAPATGSAVVAAAAAPILQNTLGSLSFSSNMSLLREGEEVSSLALSTFRAKEEEIERKKTEVRILSHLGQIEGRDRTHDHYSQEKRQRR
ncbi:hypothetical protein NL676_019666 [Syzygium grande]|nr:hypothetical protein NL676_019666 [Syzygium grande]